MGDYFTILLDITLLGVSLIPTETYPICIADNCPTCDHLSPVHRITLVLMCLVTVKESLHNLCGGIQHGKVGVNAG